MPTTNNPIDIKNLDFPEIKRSLVKFLETTTEFKGFNFEGSNINAMLDVLSYNTYYMSMYMSMLFAETFIDSATERASLVSALKPVGFVPKSVTAAKLLVNISIPAKIGENRTTLLLPEYSSFVGGGFNFVNLDSTSLILENDNFIGNNILLHQGSYQTFRFIVSDPAAFFTIPFNSIDISTLKVRVFPSLDSYERRKSDVNTELRYFPAKDLFNKTNQDQLYFIQENPIDGYFSLYFGDNIIGKQLSIGNVIETTFITSEGKNGNGIFGVIFYKTLLEATSLGGYSTSEIQVTTPSDDVKSFDGSNKQTNDFLRKFGSYHFESQERLVTENDYYYAINSFFSNVQACKVWGGEDNDPPYYATAMAMIKLYNQELLSPLQKTLITEFIKSKSVVGTDFILVDPNVIYPIVSMAIRLNIRYVSDIYYLQNRIQTFITSYCTSSSITEYRPSDLSYYIKDQEPLLSSVNISTKIKKNVYYTIDAPETHIVSFKQSIVPGSLVSSKDFSFYLDFPDQFTEEFLDDGLGHIIYKKTYVDEDIPTESRIIGVIDYTIGQLLFESITIKSKTDIIPVFTLTVTPTEIDLFTSQHSMLVLQPENITFSLQLDDIN